MPQAHQDPECNSTGILKFGVLVDMAANGIQSTPPKSAVLITLIDHQAPQSDVIWFIPAMGDCPRNGGSNSMTNPTKGSPAWIARNQTAPGLK